MLKILALFILICSPLVLFSEETPSAENSGVETPKSPSQDPLDESLKELSKEEDHNPTPLEKNTAKWTPGVGKLLTVGARLDTSFSGGGAIQQGFSIPYFRLSAYGEAGKNIDYRLTLGQTREYSSAILPQMLPVEGYVDLATNPPREGETREGLDVRLRAGMMAPLYNPWWTPDLGELPMVEYHETHRALFVAREIGAELAVRPMGEKLTLAVGAFNGSGIVSLNTNNSKAFTTHVHGAFPVGGMKVGVGASVYLSEQSVPGAINYKKSSLVDYFTYLDILSLGVRLSVDAFATTFEEPSRTIRPNGFAAMANVRVYSWLSIFCRWESSTDSPLSGKIRNFQIGPTAELSDYVKAFFIYQSLTANGSDQRMLQARLRLNI